MFHICLNVSHMSPPLFGSPLWSPNNFENQILLRSKKNHLDGGCARTSYDHSTSPIFESMQWWKDQFDESWWRCDHIYWLGGHLIFLIESGWISYVSPDPFIFKRTFNCEYMSLVFLWRSISTAFSMILKSRSSLRLLGVFGFWNVHKAPRKPKQTSSKFTVLTWFKKIIMFS